MKKRIMSMLLVLVMVLSTAACGNKEKESSNEGIGDLSWMNTESELPIVKEGTEKTLRVAINMYSDSGEPESQWFYKFIEEEMNINLEVTKISGAEQLTLLLADGEDLPDIIIGAISDEASLMRYGADEGVLADLAPYITEELTPNLYKMYSQYPEYKEAIQDSEGHIWSLGYVNNPTERGQISRVFYNYDWLETAGLSTPTTLDEFLSAMSAFKNMSGGEAPMVGSWNFANPCIILLNAFGYLTENAKGTDIALRNGKVVLPVADREAYGEYLKVLKQVYDKGLIDKNFFTMGNTTVQSKIAAGKCGFLAEAPFVYTPDFDAWWGAQPLTSQYNSTAQWPRSESAQSCGGFVVSAKSENKELAMRFADWFFEETGVNYNMSVNGPADTQKDYIYDSKVPGFTVNSEDFVATWTYYEKNKDDYSSKNDYLGKEVFLWGYRILGRGVGSVSQNLDAVQYGFTGDEISTSYSDVTTPGIQAEVRRELYKDGEMCFRLALEDTLVPYVTETYLPKAYLDAETSIEVGNLLSLIREYAAQETANFIVGRRALTDAELDKYFDEIEELGALEVVETYSKYYENK